MPAKRKHDPNARRSDETYWQHTARLARQKADARDREQAIITPETARQGIYAEEFVRHVETGTVTQAVRNKRISSLVRMHENSTISNEQFSAAMRIARIAELIERDVGFKCASLEARVDNSGSAGEKLVERLTLVQDEQAYSRWKKTLPYPKRLVLDMLLVDRPLVATARKYRTGWPRARKLLLRALDGWIEIRTKVGKEIDERDLAFAQLRACENIVRAA